VRRTQKILGSLVVAIMALGAAVSAGPAAASSFTATEVGKSLSTTTTVSPVFSITGSEVKCSTRKVEGVTEGTLEGGKYHTVTQRVHPIMESCEAFGFSSGVSVTTTGCDVIANANTTSGMGSVQLVDHAGETCNGIVITADPVFTTCTAVIPKQTVASSGSYTNNGGKIKGKATATGIEVNVTQSAGLCPLTTGLHTGANGGSLSGEGEVSASSGSIEWTA
jgi:hypothetical protein